MRITPTSIISTDVAEPATRKPSTLMATPTNSTLMAPKRSARPPPRKNMPCWLKVRTPSTSPTTAPEAPRESVISTAMNGTTR